MKTWQIKKFTDCIDKPPTQIKGIPKKEYQEKGQFPIIDQGETLIGGYANDEKKIYQGKLPVIIFGDHTRIFKYINFPFAIGADGTKIIVPREEFNPKFFFYALQSVGIESLGYSRHYKVLKTKQIPFPPLKIQKRIVARIEELFEKIDKAKELRQKTLEKTATIFPLALQEIFGKTEKKWKIRKLGEIIELRYGKGIPKEDRKTDGKYPIYGANGELGRTDKYLVEGEAIIIGRKGTAGAVNRVSGRFWPADVTYYAFGNEKIDIDFLFYILEKIDLRQLAIGIKPGINRNKVYDLQVPLPPLSEQKKIVSYLDTLQEKVEKLKKLQAETATDLAELRASILSKAMKGELVK